MKKKIVFIVLIVVVIAVAALMIFKGIAVKHRSEQLISELKESMAEEVQLTFELAQSGVSIVLDDGDVTYHETQSVVFTVPKGIHKFHFSKDGFESLQKEITAEMNENFSISLKKVEVVPRMPLPGYVKINSLPAGAEILIDNKQKGITPATIKLAAGSHTFTIRQQNFHEYSQSFTLKEDQTIDFETIELLPKFAYYSVQVIPMDAEIYLDQLLLADSEIEKTTLASGKHNLQIKKDLYYDFNEDFVVNDGEFKEFVIRLKATFGSLEINSEPEQGATVYIDEQLVGKTPYLDEMVMPGQYRVRVEKELCTGTEKILSVYEDQRTSETLVMIRNYAWVVVEAAGCDIYINNEKVGFDRCEIKLEKGQHQLKCTKENHHWLVETLNVDPANDISLVLKPEPMMADLSVESKPIESLGAQIWVNDEQTENTTPGKFQLLPGEYDISLKHRYFHDQTQHVALNYDESMKLLFKMKALKNSPVGRSLFWKNSKWASFSTTLLLVGAGAYYNYQGDLTYDKYNDATSTPDAIRYRQDTDDHLQKRDYAYSFSVVPAAWFLYSWFKQNQYQKQATERGEK